MKIKRYRFNNDTLQLLVECKCGRMIKSSTMFVRCSCGNKKLMTISRKFIDLDLDRYNDK